VKQFTCSLATLIVLGLALSACGSTRTVYVRDARASTRNTTQAASVAITASAPAPSPVATTATLSSKCVTGFAIINPDTDQVTEFSPFQRR
jgi:hypothetical protein